MNENTEKFCTMVIRCDEYSSHRITIVQNFVHEMLCTTVP